MNRKWMPPIPTELEGEIRPLSKPVGHGARVEDDPRYVPLDHQLNRVYTALRERLPRAQHEQLRQLELRFLHEREALRGNPDAFFQKTRQQIAALQQMLDSSTGTGPNRVPAAPNPAPTKPDRFPAAPDATPALPDSTLPADGSGGGQPPAETLDPTDIAGVYVGTYITGQSLFNVELQVDRTPDQKRIDAVFVCYTPGGTAKEPLGSARLKGDYDPQTRTLTLTAYEWSHTLGTQSLSGLAGTFEPSTGKLSGNLLPAKGETFEALRDPARTAQRQADAKRAARRFSEAPTLIWDARDTDERCLVILHWVSRLDREYPGVDFSHLPSERAISKLINLFTDESFIPVFGKSYEQMDKDDRERTKRIFRECRLDPNYKDQFTWHWVYLENPFVMETGMNLSHAVVAPAVAFRRLKRDHLKQVMHELETLPSTSEGFNRALSIQSTETTVKPEEADLLWPSERHSLEEAVQAAKKRVAAGALTMRLDQALSDASGYAGIVKLQQAVAANSELFDLVPPAVRDQQKARVGDRIHAELAAQVAEERVKIDGLGSGGQALRNGTRWYKNFSQTYLAAFHDPALGAVLARFDQRRQTDLSSGEAELMAAIASANGAPMIKSVLKDYLGVPSDQRSDVGRRVQAAADARLRDIVYAGNGEAQQEGEGATASLNSKPNEPSPEWVNQHPIAAGLITLIILGLAQDINHPPHQNPGQPPYEPSAPPDNTVENLQRLNQEREQEREAEEQRQRQRDEEDREAEREMQQRREAYDAQHP